MNVLGVASVLFLTAGAASPTPPATATRSATAIPTATATQTTAATPTAAPNAPTTPTTSSPSPPSPAAPDALPAVAVLPAAPAEGPDLELHVPRAEVQKLSLDVQNLQARLDVDTSVARLVTIRAGVVATVQSLKAELDGVSAETHLVVRLNRVAEVLERALAAIDKQPELAGGPVAGAFAAPAAPVPASATVGVAADAAAEPGTPPSKPSNP